MEDLKFASLIPLIIEKKPQRVYLLVHCTVFDVKCKIHNELVKSLAVIKQEELLILLRGRC